MPSRCRFPNSTMSACASSTAGASRRCSVPSAPLAAAGDFPLRRASCRARSRTVGTPCLPATDRRGIPAFLPALFRRLNSGAMLSLLEQSSKEMDRHGVGNGAGVTQDVFLAAFDEDLVDNPDHAPGILLVYRAATVAWVGGGI